MDFFTHEKTPQYNFSSKNFSVENNFSQNHDEYDEPCHKCTWFKYSNNETMKCDEFEDECEFGTGLKGKDYDKTFAFVGDKCFEHIHWRQTGLKSGGAEFETYLVKFETYLVNSRLMQ